MHLIDAYMYILFSLWIIFGISHCCYYISITIVQSYTGKYHEFVAVCIVMSTQLSECSIGDPKRRRLKLKHAWHGIVDWVTAGSRPCINGTHECQKFSS